MKSRDDEEDDNDDKDSDQLLQPSSERGANNTDNDMDVHDSE